MKNLLTTFLFTILFSHFAFAEVSDCSDLFAIKSRNSVRLEKALATIYPTLHAERVPPTAVSQYLMQETAEVLARISKLSRNNGGLNQSFRDSLASQVAILNGQLLKNFESITAEVQRNIRFYENIKKHETKLADTMKGIAKDISEIEKSRDELAQENTSLSEAYTKINSQDDELLEEAEFIKALIERFQVDSVSNPDIASISAVIQTDFIPQLIALSVNINQLRIVISNSRENIELRLRANVASMSATREIIDISLPAMLNVHPKIKKYFLESSDSEKSKADQGPRNKKDERAAEKIVKIFSTHIADEKIEFSKLVESLSDFTTQYPPDEIARVLNPMELQRLHYLANRYLTIMAIVPNNITVWHPSDNQRKQVAANMTELIVRINDGIKIYRKNVDPSQKLLRLSSVYTSQKYLRFLNLGYDRLNTSPEEFLILVFLHILPPLPYAESSFQVEAENALNDIDSAFSGSEHNILSPMIDYLHYRIDFLYGKK